MEKKYPKILIINMQSVLKNNATGITLRNNLESWPRENILELYISPLEDKVFNSFEDLESSQVSLKTFPLRTIAFFPFFRKINSKLKNERIINKEVSKNKKSVTPQKSTRSSFKKFLRESLVLLSDMSPLLVDKQTKKMVDDFNPDVIYTLGSQVSVMKIVYYFSVRNNIKVLMHFMDNWQEDIQWEGNLLSNFYHNNLKKWLKKVYSRSVFSLSISQEMAEAYTEKWNIEHLPLMNSIEVESMFNKPIKAEANEPFKIVYTGGLHLNRWKALSEISDSLALLKKNEGINNIIFEIYTSEVNRELYEEHFNEKYVNFKSYVDNKEMKKVFASANLLVHAETKNPILYRFFKYSISTKIPEYLSSNRPILFYGPDNIYLTRYLESESAAYIVTERRELEVAITKLFNEKHLRDTLAKNGYKLALKNHNRINANLTFTNAIFKSVLKVNKEV